VEARHTAWAEQPVALRLPPGQLTLRNSFNPQRRSNTYRGGSVPPLSPSFVNAAAPAVGLMVRPIPCVLRLITVTAHCTSFPASHRGHLSICAWVSTIRQAMGALTSERPGACGDSFAVRGVMAARSRPRSNPSMGRGIPERSGGSIPSGLHLSFVLNVNTREVDMLGRRGHAPFICQAAIRWPRCKRRGLLF